MLPRLSGKSLMRRVWLSGLAAIAMAPALTGCSDDKPKPGNSGPSQAAPAASVTAAADCAQLATTYVALEHDRLLANIKLAAQAQDWVELPKFDTTHRVPEADLAATVTRLGCGPELGPLVREALNGVLTEAGIRPAVGKATVSTRQIAARATSQPTAGPADVRFHWHYGRTYMFSMIPVGSLTPVGGASAEFDNNFLTSSQYQDANGNTWELYGKYWSQYHQPPGSADSPNKKFVLPDSRGGSFEAILMPDGASATVPAKAPYTYRTNNWLTSGPLMGTYNYADGGASLQSFFGHLGLDVVWHSIDQNTTRRGYVDPPKQRLLDTESDWFTFVQRYTEQVRPIANGQRIVRGSDGRVYWAAEGPDGTVLPGRPISTDLAELALELAAHVGQTPATVAVPEGGTPCTFAYQRVESCTSRHPEVVVNVVHLGDTRRCSFSFAVLWGDNTSSPPIAVPGAAGGERFLARHTYQSPGTYTITFNSSVVSGNCRVFPASYTFTLLPG